MSQLLRGLFRYQPGRLLRGFGCVTVFYLLSVAAIVTSCARADLLHTWDCFTLRFLKKRSESDESLMAFYVPTCSKCTIRCYLLWFLLHPTSFDFLDADTTHVHIIAQKPVRKQIFLLTKSTFNISSKKHINQTS